MLIAEKVVKMALRSQTQTQEDPLCWPFSQTKPASSILHQPMEELRKIATVRALAERLGSHTIFSRPIRVPRPRERLFPDTKMSIPKR
jgi:hypothetical protein